MPVALTGSLESTLTGAHFGDGGKRGVSGVWKTGLSHPISPHRQHHGVVVLGPHLIQEPLSA
jgi:hypothetical protein